ncbi:hypothetical protein BCR44DRAFT_1446619 [Catenaria anguillulae PL171]|uniref:Adenylate kinase n=1 Tax=Catenaria anguillulae PL171 TaxID=765915 RepID=A0A1Y2H634_9FUNG|nr:hypothetical protein BCR44DRAFT_1446619 [Catenaria anguillulae PL171]
MPPPSLTSPVLGPTVAFVTDVDTPVAHQVSRRLAQTVVGSRRPAPTPSDGDGDNETAETPNQRLPDNDNSNGTAALGVIGAHGAVGDVENAAGVDPNYHVMGYCRFRNSTPDEEDVPDELKTDANDPVGKSASTRDLIASLNTPGRPGKHIRRAIQRNDKENLKKLILDSSIIIVDFIHSIDDVPFILEVLNENAALFVDNPKTVIAISTILTWGRTKPDLEDPDTPLAEDEYRRRKPHPNYRTHVALEKEWVKLSKKECYRAYVVFAGLVYHAGDSGFHPMLKAAWHGADVPVYGDGENFLPMIHLDDLCELVVLLAEKRPEDMKYLLAVDDARTSYGELAKAISQALGTGKIKTLPKEQAILDRDLDQTARDHLGISLRFEPSNIKKLGLKWKYESGLLENMSRYVDEFRQGRGLTPLKVMVLGPPQVGKTYYAQKLATHYQLPYVDVDSVMKETMERLHRRVQLGMALLAGDSGEAPSGDGAVTDVAALAAAAAQEHIDPADIEGERELLEELTEYSKNNNGSFPDAHVLSFMRAKLASMACQNQGYVLDGFPLTKAQAVAVFKKEDGEGGSGGNGTTDANEDGGDAERAALDASLLPAHIVVLDAPDEWILDRCMQRPDSEVTPKTSEEGMNQRLGEYRKQNVDDVTVLNVFDESEIHPTFFNVATGTQGPVTGIMALLHAATQAQATGAGGAPAVMGTATPVDVLPALLKLIGKPHNYGPSKEDISLRRRIKAEEAARVARRLEQEEHQRQQEERDRHARALADWYSSPECQVGRVKRQEQEVLEAQSLPLRHYLMQHVMPTLSLALMEVCKMRPDDPIDFLAEYLFRHAPISLTGLDPPSPEPVRLRGGGSGVHGVTTSADLPPPSPGAQCHTPTSNPSASTAGDSPTTAPGSAV